MKTKNICEKNMTFQECELAIIRNAIDLAEIKLGKKLVNTPEVQSIIKIVEDFIKKKDLICYGGTAIDALLPNDDKIYNKDVELSDYDFFTYNALEDAKELADIYFKKSYTETEAKAGSHHGTFKLFCNFLAVADITYIPKSLFETLKKEAIRVNGILYCPPNFLKMSMYLELSRPVGQIDRWEKVYKRLMLLNKYYPLTKKMCDTIDFQREMENKENKDEIYETVQNTLVNQGVVFFGGYAISQYSQYMPKHLQQKLKKVADFDVLSNDPETTAEIVKERLKDINITNVKIIKREPVGEIIPIHYEIQINKDTIAFIYKPIACHSFNIININGQKVRIATIDTMLSFYLAFLYSDRPYYNNFSDRILCMSKFLFDVQQKNRLAQKGLLRRFSITCYGHQESVEEMRAEKSNKFKELKDKRGTSEYNDWFLNYRPDKELKKISEDKENLDKEESSEDKESLEKEDKENKEESSKKTPKESSEKTENFKKNKTIKKKSKKKKRKTKKFNFKIWK